MNVLLTGGNGFIGSHAAVALLEAGLNPIIVDDLSNSSSEVSTRIERITGNAITFIKGSVADEALMRFILRKYDIQCVMHLAAFKDVTDSINHALRYYENNVCGLITLLKAMDAENVRNLVFSSSAAVYGQPKSLPLPEDHPTSTETPYGRTKLVCEELLRDVAAGERSWRIALLRYFNPIGAHSSGLIGESPKNRPTNLMPIIIRAATSNAPVAVFGTDYDSEDGSAVRDYIHVMDLAEGHVAALLALGRGGAVQTYNLGTGRGTTVLELIRTFERATGSTVPFRLAPRRCGDVPVAYAAVAKAESELGWKATRSLEEMCSDSWRFADSCL